jgi:hypothetical protein
VPLAVADNEYQSDGRREQFEAEWLIIELFLELARAQAALWQMEETA